MDEQALTIQARDGTPLAATRLVPGGPSPETWALMAPAMGVPRRFYRRFAGHLAHQGMGVLSLDYRGVAGSAPDGLRGYQATLMDWAELDLAAAIDHLTEHEAPEHLTMVGHSVAGQLFGLIPGHQQVQRVLTVASVKGHWRLWPKAWHKAALLTLWYVVVPATTRLFGYFPARLSGLGGEDLPTGVARQWMRWGRSPHYQSDEHGRPLHEGFQAYQGHVRGYSAADDWYAPYEPTQALLDLYKKAETDHVHVDPAERGVDAIGHFGFFREAGRQAGLWDEAATWLSRS